MDQSFRQRDDHERSLRDWALRAAGDREGTRSRRLSTSSNVRSFREDDRSFRSQIVISSTASSPGCTLKDMIKEIDPSTYSFSTAIRDLQTRSGNNSWESLSPDGLVLNSKWYDAKRFICNPLSGEVPMECLSANSLNGRSFRHSLTNRITMSAPLMYPNPLPRHRNLAIRSKEHQDDKPEVTESEGEVKTEYRSTRDVGTQSNPTQEVSSGSASPAASTPSIMERSFKRWQTDGDETPSEKTASQTGDPFDGETRLSLQDHDEVEEAEGKRPKEGVEDGGRMGGWRSGNGSCNSSRRWKWGAGGCWLFLVKKKVSEKRPQRRKTLEWFII